MDKRAKKAKAKRREQKRKAYDNEVRNFKYDFEQACEKFGIKKKISVKQLMREKREAEKEIEMETNIICIVSVLTVLHKYFGFGKVRLFRTAGEITIRVRNAYNGERSIKQFAEEIRDETGVDLAAYCPDNVDIHTSNMEYKTKALAIAARTPDILTISLYAVYTYLNYGHIRLARIAQKSVETALYIVQHNKLDEYLNQLYKETGFQLTHDGKFKAFIKQDEYDKVARRVGL